MIVLINTLDVLGTNQTQMLNTLLGLVSLGQSIVFTVTDGTNTVSVVLTSGTSGSPYYTFNGTLNSSASYVPGPSPYSVSYLIAGPMGPTGSVSDETLISTIGGLGTIGYISSIQLISTTQAVINYIDSFIDPFELTSTVTGLGTLGYVSSVNDPFYINDLYVNSNIYYNSQLQPHIQFGKCNGTYDSNGYGSIAVNINSYGNTDYVINITDNSVASNGNPVFFWSADASDSNQFTAYWSIKSDASNTPDPKFYWNTMGNISIPPPV